MQILNFVKNLEISEFETFISDYFISVKKCSILMVDTALDSWESELFEACFNVFTALFAFDLQ